MSTEIMNFKCPVCGWPGLEFDPLYSACDFCNCCGTEFGFDDIPESKSIKIRPVDSKGNISEEYMGQNACKFSSREGMWGWLRNHWVSKGMAWSFGVPPKGWNPQEQIEGLKNNET